ASGKTGFDYFDTASGSLLGAITGSAPNITFQVTLGVDENRGGSPAFFIDSSSGLSVNGLSATGTLSGNLAIGTLANVDATAAATLSVSKATIGFGAPGDGKIRTPSQVVSTLQGTLNLNASLTA